ncbi:MAG: hypothetical protein APR63_00335 [Desulfuromonas sp. SDB]|nr:MAG: hypothetical protein APR63_00335 [Desulfuromonas sp. SDB]
MMWNKYPVILELNTVAWLNRLTEQYGYKINLSNIPEQEIDKLKQLKLDGIWLMGIWKRSRISAHIARNISILNQWGQEHLADFNPDCDLTGSPYAIGDYEVAPELGGKQGLLNFKARSEPLKIILDFVPNHTALDHPWIYKYPDIYVHLDQGAVESNQAVDVNSYCIAMGKDPNFSPWTDTAQLDYSKEKTRSILIEQLKEIAFLCDGLRCDMAMLVINSVFSKTWQKTVECDYEFWVEAIKQIKLNHPDFLFIAEVYWGMEWDLQLQGFDYTYDKTLYDRLKNHDHQGVFGHLHADRQYYQHLVRFIENHDEQRAASIWFNQELFAAAVITLTLPGLRLVHQGQLEGYQLKIPVQFSRWPHQSINQQVNQFYIKLLDLLNRDVFHYGNWKLLTVHGLDEDYGGVYAYLWKHQQEFYLIIINYTDEEKRGYLSTDVILSKPNYLKFREIFTDQEYCREINDNQETKWFFDLEPFEFSICELQFD